MSFSPTLSSKLISSFTISPHKCFSSSAEDQDGDVDQAYEQEDEDMDEDEDEIKHDFEGKDEF